ncbi:ChaN family lipoprotein [Magnetovibrio sp. PR-2]|uniref:ChaN family lipoprotein n=1 Tax=Magnetovibrio sp. PR-2 TaxID=3120356 RepID=UPI002FCE0435
MSFKTVCLGLSLSLALSGCVVNAQTPSSFAGAADDMRGTACVPQGTWFDPARGTSLSTQTVIERMRTRDLVLLGETHTYADHHRWQMQTLSQLYLQNPDLILGFESFPRRVQGVLDKWVAGELNEDDFARDTDWETVWKYDIGHYMPLFQFARMNTIPMVALNVDRTLIRKISANGWKNVPEDERLGVGDPAPAVQPYIDMLAAVYTRHDDKDASKTPTLDNPMFSNFVDVQLTWDRAMAEAADSALKAAETQGRTPQFVAIVGRGHMDHFLGIPEQLNHLGRTNYGVLTPWDDLRKCSDLQRGDRVAADAVFGIEPTKQAFNRPKPKLGVMIEGSDDGVLIGDVVEGSIAQKHGLQKGDVIVKAAGTPVKKVGDLVEIIKSMSPGTVLPLKIKRDKTELDIMARFPTLAEQDAAHKSVHGNN